MVEKLTSAVTVKFAPEDADDLRALADSRGMEVSEYIRHLVLADRVEARRQFDARSPQRVALMEAERGL